jgi:NTE family protein
VLVHDVISVENRDPELVTAPFDFSKATLATRADAGYRDADQALRARPARALPHGLLRTAR